MMRFEGVLKSWNEERGFGFIEPSQGTDEVFVHVTAFSNRKLRPAVGQPVTFEVELGPHGKKRARNVETSRPAAAVRSQRGEQPAEWDLASALAIPLFVGLYVVVTIQWKVSLLWAVAYALVSVITLFVYAFDKSAAVRGTWRTQETTLLALGLLGGWPGALIAQKMLRHKSSKRSFRVSFWLTVLLNVGAFLAINSPQLRDFVIR